ncbi:hypothetical protein WG901_19730 [Novosphingobium sp. PS1R-30]|uniref:Lipoyl-binding domain-containing protein n=1 Tax=Novosphingobium anseongense TaxID=3133436 RepID=A0ABU8S0W0_9SPHN
MYSDIQEIRALLLQFERSRLKDMYLKAGDWAVFMARLEGAGNPMLAPVLAGEELADQPEASAHVTAAKAPHLGLFEPACAVGDVVAAGAVIGAIDVLGRRTEVTSTATGTVVALSAAALVEYADSLMELAAAA